MGMPTARLYDLCTGHDCYPPRPNSSGSPNVFVNSRPHHRLTDTWFGHCCITPTGVGGCHGSLTCSGSSSVFVNSLPAARVMDQVCCGSLIMTGSTNVSEGG
jgi:uncharacterized Zn-binding protein involved in type VI secretion